MLRRRPSRTAEKKAKQDKKDAEKANEPDISPQEFADQYDMGPQTLMSSQGKTVGAKFGEIIALFTDESVHPQTKAYLGSQLSVWGSVAPASLKTKKLKEFQKEVFATVLAVAKEDVVDIDTSDGDKYRGVVKCGVEITKMVQMVGMQDQKLAAAFAPLAYETLSELLDLELPMNQENAFFKTNASTCRTEICCNLVRIMPFQGSVKIPTAMDIISRILVSDDYPDNLKSNAKSALSAVTMVNKQCMKTAGPAIMDLIATGEHDTLITMFAQMPDMYMHNPAAVHNQLPYILEMQYNTVCSLLYNISQKFPRELVPYLDVFLEKLEEESSMASVTLLAIKDIAGVEPNLVYKKLDRIIELASEVANTAGTLASVLGNAGKATVPADAADQVLVRLVKGLEACPEKSFHASYLNEINNLCGYFSKKEVLAPHVDTIKSFKGSSEIIVTSILDFAAGRSLAKVAKKVDELDAKVNAMNKRVEDSCKSYDDVIAYVDKNIRDVKDFVGEIVKKLPLPKRLEVVGTVRKTLILHFECVRTGREFPITSQEWNKWLKMGFSLAKSGKAIFDIGTGNPLGLLSTGAECVKGVYEAYKSDDDDEFNTYMNQPFLTSAEQDGLIEKLRAQGFFDKMSYDAQKGGWYLNNPEEDGTLPGGEKGSVSKVKSKKGVGVTDSLVAGAAAIANEVDPDMVGTVSDTLEAAGQVKEVAEEVAPQGCCTIS